MTFLLSTDGKTLAQFSKFDISKDPKQLVSADGTAGARWTGECSGSDRRLRRSGVPVLREDACSSCFRR